MYKTVLTILIVSVVVLLGIFGWNVYTSMTAEEDESKSLDAETVAEMEDLEEQRIDIQGVISEEDLASFEDKGLNPFGQLATLNELTDNMYQEYIHGMSHQKVKASEKWGFYEIHPRRIHWLLEGLDQVDLSYEETYRVILEKWKQGDFSSTDADHNAIWRLQGGTIGEATGVYSPEEEQTYLESQSGQ